MRQPSIARLPVPLPGAGDAAGPLTVSVSAREGYTLVRLDGEGDVTVRDRLLAALTAPVAAGTPHLVVDLSGLAYLDCSCVQVLWRAFRMAQEAGGMLGLAAPQPLVARMMELWGADQVIGVHDSVAEAAIAAGQKRGSRPAATEPPAERGEGGRPGAAAADGFLPLVAHGDAEAFAGVYDQVAGAVYGLVRRIVGARRVTAARPD
jgi:anti-anti-sigma factor